MLKLLAESNNIKKYSFVEYDLVLDHYSEVDEIPLDAGLVTMYGVDSNHIRNYLEQNKDKENLVGISSEVTLKDESLAHLFLLDFYCVSSSYNLPRVERFIKEILGFKSGFIYDSGQSYHFYSSEVFSKDYCEKSLQKAKSSDLVDKNWVDFQLRRGFSVLRVTANYAKSYLPVLVKSF